VTEQQLLPPEKRFKSSGIPTLTPFVLLFVLHLATLTPSFAPGSIYVPQIATSLFGVICVFAEAVAGSCVFLGVIRAIHAIGGRARRWIVTLVSAVFIILYVLFLMAEAFYAKFGIYPSPRIILDFIAAPSAFVAYTKSGTSASDSIMLAFVVLIIGLAVVATVRRVWQEKVVAWRPVANGVFGVALLWLLHSYPSREVNREHAFLVSEHSLPAAKYAFQGLTVFDSSGIEHARELIPRPAVATTPPPHPTARHVLLILAEALRADHLPAYGYARETTPFLQSDAGNWVVFKRAYAHGSRTADSFPVIFNSQYFAAIDGGNEGARMLWGTLRNAGVSSAFLSAGAMEWGGITHAIDFADIDYQLIASSVDRPRMEVTPLPFDYAVDDNVPLQRYAALLADELKSKPAFVTLHFVGSHFPFHYDDVPDMFQPSLREPPSVAGDSAHSTLTIQSYESKVNVAASNLTRVLNSYDNSIVHIDKLVQQIVDLLRQLTILDDTLIIFTADHGESLGEHMTLFHGTTLYEEQVHVPMMIRVGSNLQPLKARLASRASSVVGQVDLVPTIIDALSSSAPGSPFEGVSWLSEAAKAYELLLFRGIGEKLGVVTQDSKYLFDVPGGRSEEYSLENDPREQHDLSNAQDTTLRHFIDHLKQSGVVPNSSTSR
jgi:glucan phosphoethanolaminetransferase (alkaline phosphatase superfamily)